MSPIVTCKLMLSNPTFIQIFNVIVIKLVISWYFDPFIDINLQK